MAKQIHYADQFVPNFGLPWIPPKTEAELRAMPMHELVAYRDARNYVEKRAVENPVGAGWTLPIWPRVMENWTKYNFHVVLGGNQCVRGDTLIYDPILGQSRRIDSIRGAHHVMAFDGVSMVTAKAEQPFQKGEDEMVRVGLSNGQSFVAAPKHVVLSAAGDWLSISQLRLGSALFLPGTTSAPLREGPSPSALRSSEKASNSLCGYPTDFRLYGEQPHVISAAVPSETPSQGGALARKSFCYNSPRLLWRLYADSQACRMDAQDSKPKRIRAGLSERLLTNLDDLLQSEALFFGTQYRAFCKPCKSVSALCADQGFERDGSQCTVECPHGQSMPEFHLPGNQSSCALAYVVSLSKEETAVKWDMSVPAHGNYMAAGVIHHNSSKTMLGSRLSVWAAATIPEAECYAFHINERRSIDDQQRFVYDALPLSMKTIGTKKGIAHSLQYSQKNGFTDHVCILPPHKGYSRGGSIKFYNYQQYIQNDQIVEGIKCHFGWADEKIPLQLLETLRYRLFTYRGRLLLTYTVIDGWNDTVEKVLAKTKTVEKVWCDDPRVKGYLPVMQESLSMESTMIYYAHTKDNPFTDYQEFLKLNAKADRSTFLARAFGVPTKSISGAFPGFSREGNVIPHDQLPFVKDPNYRVTRYMAVDPGGSKHWFMLWVAIDAGGTWWVYREWPDESYGDWALPGNKPGPAQKGTNKGIKDYVEIMRAAEIGEEITDRIIDPRAGAAQRQAADGATNIISDLDDQNMVFHPAPGGSTSDGLKEVEDGIQMIVNLLSFDESKPRDSANSPRLYVSERCQNFIYAMCEYTGRLGQQEVTKDAVDVFRYLRKAGCEYLDPSADLRHQNEQGTGVY